MNSFWNGFEKRALSPELATKAAEVARGKISAITGIMTRGGKGYATEVRLGRLRQKRHRQAELFTNYTKDHQAKATDAGVREILGGGGVKKTASMREVSKVAVVRDGKLLMGRRRDTGKWTEPGGHLDNGENPLMGAARELLEETGIEANPHDFDHLASKLVKKPDGSQILVHAYLLHSDVKLPTTMKNDPDEEVHRWHWVDIAHPRNEEKVLSNLHVPMKDNIVFRGLGLTEGKELSKAASPNAVSAFWEGFEKRSGMEKEAVLAAAPIHFLQNLVMERSMHNKGFAKTLASEFQGGLMNKPKSRLRQFLSSFGSGATVPENSLLKNHMRTLGDNLRAKLISKGVKDLHPRELVFGRKVARGDFASAMKHFDPKNKTHQAILEAASEHVGHDLSKVSPDTFPSLEKAWKDKASPITSNILPELGRSQGKPAARKGIMTPVQLPTEAGSTVHRGAEFAGQMAGSALMGMADPATGAMNAFKGVTSTDAGRRLLESSRLGGYGKKFLSWADRKFLKAPMNAARESGLAGESLGKVEQTAKTYGLNAVTAQMENSTNRLAKSVHSANPQARVAPAHAQQATVPAAHAQQATVPAAHAQQATVPAAHAQQATVPAAHAQQATVQQNIPDASARDRYRRALMPYVHGPAHGGRNVRQA